MNNDIKFFEKTKWVDMSECDNLSKLSYPSFFSIFMDAATVHGDVMGVSSPALAKHNLFWVVTRSRIRFYSRPKMLDNFTIRTWPTKPEILRSLRYCSFYDEKGVFAEGKTEWIMLNRDTFRPTKTTGIYPENSTFLEDTVLDEPWMKFDADFSSPDRVSLYTVKSTDIDLSKHMNNVAYVRALFSAFSTREIELSSIKEIELSYKSQCFEGDNLEIKIKKSENGFNVGFFRENSLAITANVVCNNDFM